MQREEDVNDCKAGEHTRHLSCQANLKQTFAMN